MPDQKPHKIVKMKISDLKPAPYNPRSITPEAMAGLRASIKRFGIVDLIVLNEHTDTIISGHQRLAAMIAEGITETEVLLVDLPESEERILNITLNNPNIQGTFDMEKLDPLLEEIQEEIPEEEFEKLMLDYLVIDELPVMEEQDSFSSYLSDKADEFGVTFVFPKVHEEEIQKGIKENGKDYFVKLIMTEMGICHKADLK